MVKKDFKNIIKLIIEKHKFKCKIALIDRFIQINDMSDIKFHKRGFRIYKSGEYFSYKKVDGIMPL